MTKVELTAPDGSKIWVFPAWIQLVRKALPHEGSAKTAIVLSGPVQLVTESVAEVLHRLELV